MGADDVGVGQTPSRSGLPDEALYQLRLVHEGRYQLFDGGGLARQLLAGAVDVSEATLADGGRNLVRVVKNSSWLERSSHGEAIHLRLAASVQTAWEAAVWSCSGRRPVLEIRSWRAEVSLRRLLSSAMGLQA